MKKPKTKRKMTEFSISEFSAVDRPAQTHAIATIQKRAPRTQLEDLKAEADRVEEILKGLAPNHTPKEAKMDFIKIVDQIVEEDGINRTDAMAKARKEFPDEYRTYQDASLEKPKPAAVEKASQGHRRPDEASRAFMSKARELRREAAEDGRPISLHVAMSKTRDEYPELHEAYANA